MASQLIEISCHACGSAKQVANPAWLREQRERVGMTLAMAGKRFGVGKQFLSQVERGESSCPEWLMNAYYHLTAT